MIDEYAAHQARRDAQEMRPVLPAKPLRVDEPDECFVHQRSDLQRVTPPLARHVGPRQPAELRLHEQEQLLERGLVAVAPCAEQAGDLTRRSRSAAYHEKRNIICVRRMNPSCEPICPNVDVPFETDTNPLVCTRLKRLNTSSFTCASLPPPTGTFFDTETSVLMVLGVRTSVTTRGALPRPVRRRDECQRVEPGDGRM